MLVFLPPSAGKTAPEKGRRVGLTQLAYARALRGHRERLIDAIDSGLREAPAAPAAEVYTGVLYERLQLGELPESAWDKVLIASALWGVVRPGDRIPAYQLDMSAKPRGTTSLAAFWRPALTQVLPDRGLIVDMRSGSYAAAWKPQHAAVLGVRGFTEHGDGSRKVITHMAKRVRGDVGRLLLSDASDPSEPGEVAEIARAGGLRVELGDDYLDVIESA